MNFLNKILRVFVRFITDKNYRKQFRFALVEFLLKYDFYKRFGGGRVLHSPLLIGLEPTNRCNLNCKMCARRYWDAEANPLGDMSKDLFDKYILPEAKGKEFLLQIFGEPLMGDNFFYMLEKLQEKGCPTIITTNGILLSKYYKELVDLGLGKIVISFDGLDTLPEIRGIKKDIILQGIEKLNQYKKEKKVNHPEIFFNFVILRENLRDLPAVIELASKVGCKNVSASPAVIHSKELENENLFDFIVETEEVFEKAKKTAKESGVNLSLPPLKDAYGECLLPFKQIFVNFDGDVRPCCVSTINEKDSMKLGNIKDRSLHEYWNCEKMIKIRKSLLDGKNMEPFCKGCTVWYLCRENLFRILP